MEELNHGTYTRREQRWFTQCDCWIRPWAVRAVSGHTIHDDPEKNLMELDPHKFAISPPLSPVNQLGGASHATSCRNLLSIVETGILPGASIDEGYNSRYEAGRLHSYYGVFALWDPKIRQRNKEFQAEETKRCRWPCSASPLRLEELEAIKFAYDFVQPATMQLHLDCQDARHVGHSSFLVENSEGQNLQGQNHQWMFQVQHRADNGGGSSGSTFNRNCRERQFGDLDSCRARNGSGGASICGRT